MTVNDTQLPVLTGVPDNMVLSNDPAQCFAVVNWALPEISDNCSIDSFSGTHESGFEFPLGTTSVSYTLIDTTGNTSVETFDVTVNDTEMPILVNMPLSVTVVNDPGQCGANVDWVEPIPWDNCNLIDFDASHQPGSFFPTGVTTVNFVVIDGIGQITTASFDVTVDDDEAPMINGMPADRTVSADSGLCSAIHEWTPPVPSDNCDVVSFIASHQPGDAFSVGVTEVSYTVMDSAGISTSDQFMITVIDTEHPQIIRIPNDISLLASEGSCEAVAEWIAPDSQDNCGIASFDISHASGSSYVTGVTTVEITTEDLHGNVSNASFTVTVLDDQPPVLTDVPADISLTADAGVCGASVSWNEPTASDNCQAIGLGSDHPSGSFFDVGTTIVTYTVADPSSNVTELSFSVNVTDDENPQFVGFNNLLVVPADSGICEALVTWDDLQITDNCSVADVTTSHPNSSVFPEGDTEVQVVAIDINGNETVKIFTVRVVDQELPEIFGTPDDIVVSTVDGSCGAPATWIDPIYSDNCVATGLGPNIPSGSFFAEGTTTVTYSVVDAIGNINSESFTVTVNDEEGPVFSNIADLITRSNSAGLCSTSVSWDAPEATDNCGMVGITSSHISGQEFPVGDTVVSYLATDIHGNETEVNSIIRVLDDEDPQFTSVPENQLLQNETGQCGVSVTWDEPTASDNCALISIDTDHQNGSFFDVGTTVVTFTATDSAGLVSTEELEITVVDLELPVISGMPIDVTLTADFGGCVVPHEWTMPEATDNCQIQSFISNYQSGDLFSVGINTVSYTAQDPTGNIKTESFTVTVSDQENPIISGTPENIEVMTDSGFCTAVVDWVPETSSDNCGILEHTSSHNPQDVFDLGMTTVEITVSDLSGNIVSSSFTVTVLDDEKPVVIDLPADITVGSDIGSCGALVTWLEPTHSDNCSVVSIDSDIASNSMFALGDTVVTYTVEDVNGNSDTASFTVTVNDVEAPTISGIPQNIELVAPDGSCTAQASWVEPNAEDCVSFELTSDEQNGGDFSIGLTVVTYTAVDPNGNMNSASFSITVLDEEAPAINGLPASIEIENDPGACSAIATWIEPTASDCSEISSLDPSQQSGTEFPIGTTEVVYTAIDGSGNLATDSFTVTVLDTEFPVILDLPQDLVLSSELGLCGAVATWQEPSSEDNCAVAELGQDILNSSFFSTGTTTVTYSSMDSSGNVTEESFFVTVNDVESPVIEGLLSDVVLENQLGFCGATHDWVVPAFLDNCAVAEVIESHQPGDFFNTGVTEVSYLVTDTTGLSVSASFTVTVNDLENPQIVDLPADLVLPSEPGLCGSVANWDEPGALDNCAVAELVSDISNGSYFTTGTTTVTYSVTDSSGNLSHESFDVIVNDVEPPVIEDVLSDVVLDTQAGLCGSTHDWAVPNLSDNCGVSDHTESHQPGDFFTTGDTIVSYSVTDTAGLTVSSSFTITVADTELPEISNIPSDITLIADVGLCGTNAFWDEPASSDNCQENGLSSNITSGSFFDVGMQVVTYSVTDTSGNTQEESFFVTVEDHEAPVIDGVLTDVVIGTQPGDCGSTHHWDIPSYLDNCGISEIVTSHVPGDFFAVGLTVVSYLVTDNSGHTAERSFTIQVADLEIPQILTMPVDVVLENDPGVCGAVHTWDLPETFDNCEVIALVSNHQPGETFPLGETIVVYTAQDLTGNVVSDQFTVTVNDHEGPTFSGLQEEIVVSCDPGTCVAVVDWVPPSAADNCELLDFSISHEPGSTFALGSSIVSLQASDVHGNESTASFSIIVLDEEDPEIFGTPADITLTAFDNFCGAIADWTEPTASDNCQQLGLTSTHSPQDFFEVGTTIVTYSVSDQSGNLTESNFTVTVTDDEIPTFSILQDDFTVPTEDGICGAVVTWVEPIAVDNCGISSVTLDMDNNTYLDKGEYLITATVEDVNGNIHADQFTVTVADMENPLLHDMPEDITLVVETGDCKSLAEWEPPTTSDNCSGEILASNYNPGTYFVVGVTDVHYVVTDNSGNSHEETFSVTVIDDQFPVITNVPEDIHVSTDPSVCSAVVDWIQETASDNCWVDSHTSSKVSGDVFDLGTTLVEIEVADPSGNVSTASFNVTVVDNESPQLLNMTQDISIGTDIGSCGAEITWVEPTPFDNCEAIGFTSDIANGSFFSVGPTLVTYSVEDPSGNSHTDSFLVFVSEDEAPTIADMPTDVVINVESGLCGSSFDWTPPTITDNCIVDLSISTHQPGAFFPVGDSTVIYTGIDTVGNETSASFVVTVVDNELPTITDLPSDISISNDIGVCGAVHEWSNPSVADNCSISSFTQSHNSGDLFPIGETNVEFIAVDLSGNTFQQQFKIIVVDDEAPQIVGISADITIDTDLGSCTSVVDWIPESSTDNCSVLEHNSSHQPGDAFDLGTTFVEIDVMDVNGNTSTSSFSVTVIDNELPVIIGLPADIQESSESGLCGAFVNWVEPTASDNCQAIGLGSDIENGSLFAVGSTVVNYSVEDSSGNPINESFVVTITDVEAPTITDVPQNTTISAQVGLCGSTFDWIPPTVTDNCQIESVDSTQQPGDFFNVGTTTVMYTAIDNAGLSTTATFTVEVLDEEVPVIVGMPADAIVPVTSGTCSAVHEWVEPTATDNCDDTVLNLQSDIQNGHVFDLGMTVVTYTTEDSAGLITTSQFTVTVEDNESPVISNVPDRVIVNTANNSCTTIAEWAEPNAVDNCELVSFTSSHHSGDTFPSGDTTVVLNAVDASGNQIEESFLVTVVDIQIPSIIGLPSSFSIMTDPGICGALVTWETPFAVDNCGVESLTSDISSGTFMTPGITTVTYTAIDVNGNTLISGFEVTVLDLENPEILNPSLNLDVLSEAGHCDAMIEWDDVVASDNCSVDTIESSHVNGDRFPVGTTFVTITVTDVNGNSTSHVFSITVVDEEIPIMNSVPLDISVENDLSVCGALVSWEEPIASDNCTVEVLNSDHGSGDLFAVGTTPITYIATDSSGNTSEVTFTVTVIDSEDPEIIGLPEIVELDSDPGECTAVVSWELPTYTDNCSVLNTMSTHVPGDVFNVGDTIVTYSASDTANIATTVSFIVRVNDHELPQIFNMPADMVVSNDFGDCRADVAWASPSASDNCGIENLTSDIENSSLFDLGTTTVTYTATDIHGNVSSASFTVTVEDNEDPVLHGLPVSIQLGSEPGLCGASATWDEPSSFDNCEVAEVTRSHESGHFFPVGTTTVIYLTVDASGNQIESLFDVIVTDVEGPSIVGLPVTIDVENTVSECGTLVTWDDPIIEDACDTPTFSSTHTSGDFFPVGQTTVEYFANDLSGNASTYAFVVTVNDTELPVITSLPLNQVVNAPPGHCAAAVNWNLPTATDNCEVSQLVTSFYSGMEYSVGTTTVLVVATDSSNNQVTASFQITVLDDEYPVIVGMPNDLTYSADSGLCGTSVSWLDPTGVDGCGLASFESSHSPGSFFNVGSTIVTYVATDTSGNSVLDTFTVTVQDNQSPNIVPPLPVTVTAPVGECGSYVDVPALETLDACGDVVVVNDFNGTENASGYYTRGNTLINWTATDINGNVSFSAGIVTVLIDSPDCNGNNNPDVCDISTGTSTDCNLDGIPDDCQPDCDGDGIPNSCEIEQGSAFDCDEDGMPDGCEISSGTEVDCDSDGIIDGCEISSGTENDCDLNGVPDSCEISNGLALDCNGNSQPDICDIASGIEADCDLDGVPDSCQISNNASLDCDLNGSLDVCDLDAGTASDCNANGILDSCDLVAGQDTDCNDNQVLDACDLATGVSSDCNFNGTLDVCDLDSGTALDCDNNGTPDSCEISSGATPDCNTNGIPDSCDLLSGNALDCNGTGIPDSCEVASGAEPDCNSNGLPDDCDIAAGLADCDGNGILDNCEIGNGQVADCNDNGIPDGCDLSSGVEDDCDGTGVPDSCEVFSGTASDCNDNGLPDSCDIASGAWADCDLDGDIDSCEILLGVEQDCNATGIPDSCEISNGSAADCDGNSIPDTCELIDGSLSDCNQNNIPDSCEIAEGFAEDCNGNGVPDSCDLISGTATDFDGDGIPDACQVNFRRGDGNGDGIVNIADGVFLLVNLFAGGVDSTCDDAADSNDDGSIDVSDVITILGFQFNGTNPPPAPFDNCGVDPTDGDGLGCALYNACP
ncbi:MAG: HYR domain-containing protein [Planctomycetota bacterium]